MLNRFLNHIHSRPELLILVLVITIIAMIIIPLSTYLVDFLIGLNIVIAMLVFMGAFYIDRILSFSTFPAVLLITTLFRLALTISTALLNKSELADRMALYYTCYPILTLCGIPNNVIRFSALTIA
ncbi:FHIPEP family type III secretion protein, partial [Sodalis sp. (in: enterobacteria)]|uniref:FHIPEP family type III secretion protein n=1 Tax=Sodalis sp. (in: enterobacteria) TaxID=1898979 RepID=UPI003F41B387